MVLDLTLVFASVRLKKPVKIFQPHFPEIRKAETMNVISLPKVKLTNRIIYVIFNVYTMRV